MENFEKAYEALAAAFPNGLKGIEVLRIAGVLACDVLAHYPEAKRREMTESFVDTVYTAVLDLHRLTGTKH